MLCSAFGADWTGHTTHRHERVRACARSQGHPLGANARPDTTRGHRGEVEAPYPPTPQVAQQGGKCPIRFPVQTGGALCKPDRVTTLRLDLPRAGRRPALARREAVAGAMKSGAGEAGTAASLPAPITRRAGARWVRPMDQRRGPAPAAQADDPGSCQCPAPGAMGAAQWAGQSH